MLMFLFLLWPQIHTHTHTHASLTVTINLLKLVISMKKILQFFCFFTLSDTRINTYMSHTYTRQTVTLYITNIPYVQIGFFQLTLNEFGNGNSYNDFDKFKPHQSTIVIGVLRIVLLPIFPICYKRQPPTPQLIQILG